MSEIDNDKRVAYMMENFENIVKAKTDFEVQRPKEPAFAIILTAMPEGPGQIAVLSEYAMGKVCRKQKGRIKEEIEARWSSYRDDPLLIVETSTGTFRTSLISAQLRAVGAIVISTHFDPKQTT